MVRDAFVLMILLLVVISPVLAGESYDVDFSEVNINAVLLFEGDEVRFDVLGATHSLIIEEVIGIDTVKFDIVPFIGEGNVAPGIVGLDTVMKVDLNRDGINDISVALYSVSESGEVHIVIQDNTKSQSLGEDNAVSGDVVAEPGLVGAEEESKSYTLYYILAALVVLGVGYMVYKKDDGSAKEEKETEKKNVRDDIRDEEESSDDVLREVEAETIDDKNLKKGYLEEDDKDSVAIDDKKKSKKEKSSEKA
jgi:hypothetical protein